MSGETFTLLCVLVIVGLVGFAAGCFLSAKWLAKIRNEDEGE